MPAQPPSRPHIMGAMTGAGDNVIPFPGGSRSGDEGAVADPDPRVEAERLARELLAQGHDPATLVQQLLATGQPSMPPLRRQATLGERRDEPVRYRVRVDLDHAKPPVWRRLELASDLTLADVHEILQAAMGWTDTHLHHFLAGPGRRDHMVDPFLTDFDEEEGEEGLHERDVHLDQVLTEVGDRLFYEYDFGDGWEHTLRLEEVLEHDEEAPRAAVTGGRRACPPEDCGGIGGYDEVLRAFADPDGADPGLLDWLPVDYDPAELSVEEADRLVRDAVAGLGGTRAVAEALAERGLGFSAALTDLVERSRGASKPLAALVSAARLDDADGPDAAGRAALVRPLLRLLAVLGPDGVRLTKAGWLPPTAVTTLVDELDMLETWIGKGNREDLTLPVLNLRETGQALGLLRKSKGWLIPTKLGTRLTGDPEGLWQHLVERLPLGSKLHQRDAGVVMLLSLAAGLEPHDGMGVHGPDLLWSAGWAVDHLPPSPVASRELARPTWTVLQVVGADRVPGDRGTVPPMGRQLAREALRSRT